MRQTSQLTSGFIIHVVIVLLFVCFVSQPESPVPRKESPKTLVWTAQLGLGGGGGGGDLRKAAPGPPAARRLPEEAQFLIPSAPAVLNALELPGVVAVLSASGLYGDGADAGKGNDPGPGTGPGTGPGKGPGDGPMRPGMPGVAPPTVVHERRPEYTTAAMSAKVQGTVELEAVVLPDGSVGDVRVVRSLDDRFGLDQKAIEVVREWRFRAGTWHGKPVAMTVVIALTFTLR